MCVCVWGVSCVCVCVRACVCELSCIIILRYEYGSGCKFGICVSKYIYVDTAQSVAYAGPQQSIQNLSYVHVTRVIIFMLSKHVCVCVCVCVYVCVCMNLVNV